MDEREHRTGPRGLVGTRCETPWGPLALVASPAGLRAVLWHGVPAVPAGDSPHLRAAASQLAEYAAGTRRAFDLALDPLGTAFQVQAWLALAEIPFAATRTYGEQARLLGRPRAARAVGAANGANPLSIVLPCHRLVGAGGGLTGYGGGLDAKRALLAHERAVAAPR